MNFQDDPMQQWQRLGWPLPTCFDRGNYPSGPGCILWPSHVFCKSRYSSLFFVAFVIPITTKYYFVLLALSRLASRLQFCCEPLLKRRNIGNHDEEHHGFVQD